MSKMWESGDSETTKIGYINRNNQLNCGHRGIFGSDHNQYAYKLICQKCNFEYGANGTDIFQRKCPQCQDGTDGVEF